MSDRKSEVKGFIIDIASAGAVVVVVMLILLAYSGIWPPMVVVESGSMQHNIPGEEPLSYVGVIDTGDLVLVKRVDSSTIKTYVDGMKEGYSTYGEYGDVIIYYPLGDTSKIPIIHRAIIWLEFNTTTMDSFDIPSLIDYPGNWSIVPYELNQEYVHKWYDLDGKLYLYNIGYYNVTVEINLRPLLMNSPHSGYITMGDNAATNAPIYDQAGSISWAHPVRPSEVKGVARGELPWFGLLKLFVLNGGIPPRTPSNSVANLIISLVLIIVLPFAFDTLSIRLRKKRGEGGATSSYESETGPVIRPGSENSPAPPQNIESSEKKTVGIPPPSEELPEPPEPGEPVDQKSSVR